MYDLLYMSDRTGYNHLKNSMLKKWPAAIIEDSSDDIHPYRFSIDIDIDKDEYLLSAFVNGFFNCSFFCQMLHETEYNKYLYAMRKTVEYLKSKDK